NVGCDIDLRLATFDASNADPVFIIVGYGQRRGLDRRTNLEHIQVWAGDVDQPVIGELQHQFTATAQRHVSSLAALLIIRCAQRLLGIAGVLNGLLATGIVMYNLVREGYIALRE